MIASMPDLITQIEKSPPTINVDDEALNNSQASPLDLSSHTPHYLEIASLKTENARLKSEVKALEE
jgi:hypothetical protein